MLTPVLALIIWTLLVWLWMYARRLPAMQAAKIAPQEAKHPGTYADRMPSGARAVADNYNHLHEQPTLFYALAFYTHLAGNGDGLAVALAWGYVALRIAHSLVQNTINLVVARFVLFSLGTFVLMALAAKNVLAFL
ncbi:MAG: MAPEG family protein [Pseudomonadota bacterium]